MTLSSDPGEWLYVPKEVPTGEPCRGKGTESDDTCGTLPGERCRGQGNVMCVGFPSAEGVARTVPNPLLRVPCPECSGRKTRQGLQWGSADWPDCPTCNGEGTVTPEWVEWSVPVVHADNPPDPLPEHYVLNIKNGPLRSGAQVVHVGGEPYTQNITEMFYRTAPLTRGAILRPPSTPRVIVQHRRVLEVLPVVAGHDLLPLDRRSIRLRSSGVLDLFDPTVPSGRWHRMTDDHFPVLPEPGGFVFHLGEPEWLEQAKEVES